jgi:hypothetical protein
MINLAASRPEPFSLQQAKTAIEQFLLNERKRKLIAEDLQALRSSVPAVYMRVFATVRRPAYLPRCPNRRQGRHYRPTLVDQVTAKPQVNLPIELNAASAPNASTIDSGMGIRKEESRSCSCCAFVENSAEAKVDS